MKKITDYTLPLFEEYLISESEKKFHAKQIWKWIYREGGESFQDITNISKRLREILTDEFSILALKLDERVESSDGTVKYLFLLEDGAKIESVLIPESGRVTICVSSQVGCKYNCSFCATGEMGFSRDLSSGEIVSQILYIQNDIKKRVTNVVFMGMGEPLDNYDHVIKAADIMNSDQGLAIGTRKITISSFGLIPGISRMIRENIRYGLAISLHSPFENERSKIMPANRKYSLKTLLPELKSYTKKSKRKVVFEYVMLSGVNDSIKHADELIKILSALPSKLNLIRYHNNDFSSYDKSSDKQLDKFYRYILNKKRFPVMIRGSRGEDISAACGQLICKK
jgi:23S rRNA (adenine2503-C2)-methyltransferase